MATQADVTAILGPADLAALRAGYQPAAMNHATIARLAAAMPTAAPWLGAVMEQFYPGTVLAPRERELVLLAMLAARGGAFTLSIHVYWALAEGVSPAEIAQVLLLAGMYDGMSAYVGGLVTFQKTCLALKAACVEGTAASTEVLARLMSAIA